MAFTDPQLVDIRRFCGFPAYANFGWVYVEAYGILEIRMANMSANEQLVVVNTYLTNLYTLETAIINATANLSTDKAAAWKHNKNEVSDRTALFNQLRRQLCAFIGVPPGPGLNNSSCVVRT